MLILLSVGLSGCKKISNSIKCDMDKFIGIWESEFRVLMIGRNYTDTMIYFSDGTLSMSIYGLGSSSGTWDIKDGKFVLTVILQYYFQKSFAVGPHVSLFVKRNNKALERHCRRPGEKSGQQQVYSSYDTEHLCSTTRKRRQPQQNL